MSSMAYRVQKVLFLGAMAVGKTSVIRRQVEGTFDADYRSTLGVQLHEVRLSNIDGPPDAVFWDTDGDAETAILSSPYARGASAAVLVCDASRPETISVLVKLAEAFADFFPGRPAIAFINKVDLVTPDDAVRRGLQSLVDDVVPTSALDGRGVGAGFALLSQMLKNRTND
jgi:GTPase SAR1 family protein